MEEISTYTVIYHVHVVCTYNRAVCTVLPKNSSEYDKVKYGRVFYLKGQCNEIFDPFYLKIPPGPDMNKQKRLC